MLKPAEMKWVDILVLEKDIDGVTEMLGEFGGVQLVDAIRPAFGSATRRPDAEPRRQRWLGLLQRIDAVLRSLDIQGDLPTAAEGQHDLESLDLVVQRIESQVHRVADRERKLADRETQLRSTLKEVEPFKAIPATVERMNELSFLHFAVGTLPRQLVGKVDESVGRPKVLLPFTTPDGTERVVAVTDKKGRWELEGELEQSGFVKDEISEKHKELPGVILERVRSELAEVERGFASLAERRRELRDGYSAQLLALKRRADVEQKHCEAQESFARTDTTYLISGWVSAAQESDLRERLAAATGDRMLMDSADPREVAAVATGEEETPTSFSNPRLLRPFERLTAGYGVPRYAEIEPTLFVAVSFLLMFGLMFGDLGQGAVIALVGLLLNRSKKLSLPARDTGFIMVGAGLSAMFFGLMFGSVFSYEGLIPALWTHPLHDIKALLKVGIILGVSLISLGVVLNVVNCFNRGDLFQALFDKYGVVGGVFYWGCLVLAVKALFTSPEAIRTGEVVLLAVVPLAIFFFRVPIYNLLAKKRQPLHGGLATYVMESVVEVIEIVSSFLANTASFARVSAFALGHAGLGVAIFSMAQILRDMSGGTFLSICAIVVGNMLVIVLEGLVVSIQSIRLEYYEFFSKFFKGEGKRFEPFATSG